MNTHIIIPIKEWETQREFYRNKLREIDKAKIAPNHEYYRLQGICANMDSILAHQKQISLDKKDIEEKAKAAFDDSYALKETRVQAYKQALNELL